MNFTKKTNFVQKVKSISNKDDRIHMRQRQLAWSMIMGAAPLKISLPFTSGCLSSSKQPQCTGHVLAQGHQLEQKLKKEPLAHLQQQAGVGGSDQIQARGQTTFSPDCANFSALHSVKNGKISSRGLH